MTKLLPLALVLLPPLAGQAASLEATTSAGDTASVVANCLAGSYPSGGDVRGCTDLSSQSPVTVPATTLQSASWATYASGLDSRATSSAALGTLRAMAQTSIPSADGLHNLQSHAYADMQDTLVASSSLGALYDDYLYAVNITGAATPSNATYDIPSIKSDAYVQINIRGAATGDVLVQRYWETSDTVLGGGVITGMVTGVPVNTLLSLEVFIEVESGIVTLDPGQGGFAQADYSDTVRFTFDALTPGANTVSTAGYDYASAAVPEPAIGWLLAAGLSVIGVRLRRRRA